jgi:transposase
MRILGVDLGQSKSAWAQMDSTTGELQQGWVGMDEAAWRHLLDARRPDQVVIESGPLAARVHDLAVAGGVRVLVADTNQAAWSWKNVKRKTDPDDALKLVRLALLGQIHPVHVPAPAVRQLRAVLEYRRALVAERTRCKNRIRAALLSSTGERLPAGQLAWSATARAALAARVKPLAACAPEELWRGLIHTELQHLNDVAQRLAEVDGQLAQLQAADSDVARVASLPGVGWPTAQVIVTVLDGARRFASRRQVSAYAGLTPRRFQSGQMDRSGRISKRGSRLLRWALNQAAWVAVRCSSEWRAIYLRLGGGTKKRRKQAIVALMRKLLVVAWALLRDQSCYEPQRLQARRTPAPLAA